jgi:anhydro-N-acetylmuramic acid kinase
MAKDQRTFVGLHCGPSADGADAALVEISGAGEKMQAAQRHFLHRPLPEDLRKRLRSVAGGWATPAAGLAGLDRDMGAFFAEACAALLREASLPAKYVTAVGMLGPAVGYVRPTPSAGSGAVVEVGSAPTLARETKRPVVNGFRQSDLAAGGVGGPVTAWPDWLLFRDGRLSRVVVQLGALASIAFIGSAAAACEVVAFDAGPGTILIDAFAQQLFESPMDADGALAARGEVHEPLLNELMAGEYFRRQPPKLAYAADWTGPALPRVEMMAGKHRCRAADLMATLTELSARAVAQAVLTQTERPHEVILAGGGAMNIHLAGRIRALLSPCSTYSLGRYGMDLRAHAAVCCAVLAAARLDGFPAHCPAATGAGGPTVLGAVWAP